jgi:glycosyltransferase involved in cell wall biosynthesis
MAGGGAERQLVYLSEELVRRGWDVHVALIKEGSNFESLAATGTAIHKISTRGNHDLGLLWRLMQLIRAIRPRLVQTWLTQMDVCGGISSRLTRTPFILSERSCAPAYPPSFKHRLRVSAGRHATAIVSNSLGGSRYWKMQIGNRVATYVVPNALPLPDIEKTRDSGGDLRLPAESRVLLFAGRFSLEKNILTIIRAFKRVLIQQAAVLLLCGKGELQPEIEEIIRVENLGGRVILPGYVQNLWKLMKQADLFISASTFEGHPNAVLEAMACGCPLIVSDIPAHRDFLDEEEATFVDPDSIADIAHGILGCLENPERTREKARKAKSKAASYSVAAVADKYEKIYHLILSS